MCRLNTYCDCDYTENARSPTDHPPSDSINRLCSNSPSTASADVGPVSSSFNASAASRIAREARSRTARGPVGGRRSTPGESPSRRRPGIGLRPGAAPSEMTWPGSMPR